MSYNYPLDPNAVVVDEKLFKKVAKKKNSILRKSLLKPQEPEFYSKFLRQYQNLEDIMNMKNAAQEATTQKELEEYTENLDKATKFIAESIDEDRSEYSHTDIILLSRTIEPKAFESGYRKREVLAGKCPPPPPGRVESSMEQFLYRLNETVDNTLRKAAFAHLELARIHPFRDGNGRTARALANWILLEDMYLPTFISSKEKKEYIDVLQKAMLEIEENEGIPGEETTNFFNGFAKRVNRSLDIFREEMNSGEEENCYKIDFCGINSSTLHNIRRRMTNMRNRCHYDFTTHVDVNNGHSSIEICGDVPRHMLEKFMLNYLKKTNCNDCFKYEINKISENN